MKLNRLIACVMAATLFASNFAFAQNSPTTTPSSAQAGGAQVRLLQTTVISANNNNWNYAAWLKGDATKS